MLVLYAGWMSVIGGKFHYTYKLVGYMAATFCVCYLHRGNINTRGDNVYKKLVVHLQGIYHWAVRNLALILSVLCVCETSARSIVFKISEHVENGFIDIPPNYCRRIIE